MVKTTLSSCMRSIDSFSIPLSSQFGTVFGACMSLIMWFVVSVYGINKLVIMNAYGDTQFNQYSVKNELDVKEFSQEELGFWFAFSAFNFEYDLVTENDIFTNRGFERFIEYRVALWTQEKSEVGFSYVEDEVFTLHQCNETDKSYLSKNYDYIDLEELTDVWPQYLCLDNPEKLALRQSGLEDRRSLYIEVYYCRDKPQCASQEEIDEWKELTKEFILLTTSRKY